MGKIKEEPISEMEKAQKLLAQLKEANEKLEKQISDKQEMMAQDMLGGQSSAGHIPLPPKVETDEEYVERFMRGDANPLRDDGFI